MPYNIEHAARISSPTDFDKFARENNKLGDGIHVIWGIKKDKTEIQAIRFDKNKFTPTEAKKWLTEHNYNPIEFEVAAGEKMKADEINLIGDCIPLVEKTGNELMMIKIIQPGWGSTGYYKEEALKDAAPKYRAGTKMFWNHQTKNEEEARPEGDLNNLAGVLVTDGTYQENGVYGKGIYAKANIFSKYRPAVKEMANHIGISHIASGVGKKGEAEGKEGIIIEGINQVRSVDFVTQAGAGGAVVSMFESYRNDISENTHNGGEKDDIMADEMKKEMEDLRKAKEESDKKFSESQKQMEEMNKQLFKLQESDRKTRAKEIAVKELETSKLPDPAKKRIAESLSHNPPVKDGMIDLDEYNKQIKSAIESEQAYLDSIIEKTGGKIKGMGESKQDTPETNTDETRKKLKETWKHKYLREGKSTEEAEKLVALALGE